MILLLALLVGPSAEPRTTAFVDVHLLPMDREVVLADQTLIVEGDRIVALGPADEVAVPDDARVVDGEGRFLMPGLVDMHVHTWSPVDLDLFLANGVTSVRNLYGSPYQLAWRARIESGELSGPTIYTSGPIIDGKPATWPGSYEVVGPEEVLDIVETHVSTGYDFFKVYNGLPREAYDELVLLAAETDLPIVGHVPDAVGVVHALESGQRTIEHLEGYVHYVTDPARAPRDGQWANWLQAWSTLDPQAVERIAKMTAAHEVWNCPTLIVMDKFMTAEQAVAERERPHMRYAPATTLTQWAGMARSAELTAAAASSRAGRFAMVAALREAGAKIALGTDTGNPWVLAGFSLHEELALLVEAGLTPYEALYAGTVSAAACLEASEEFGRLAPGLRADLLLLEANPFEDVARAGRVAGVMTRGRWHDADDLARRLEGAARD